MKKKLIFFIVLNCLMNGSSFSYADGLKDQREAFFKGVREQFQFQLKEFCAESNWALDKSESDWNNETYESILESRDPVYLKAIYCMTSDKIRAFLEEKATNFDSEEDLLKESLYSFYTVHYFYNLVIHKVEEITLDAIKNRYDKHADLKKSKIP